MKLVLVLLSNNIFGCNVRGLSSVLKSRGHDVRLFFVSGKMSTSLSSQIVAKVLKVDPDAVGISVMTDTFPDAAALTKDIRKATSAPVLWGGIHTGISPESSVKHADYIFMGEADNTLPEFLEDFKSAEPSLIDGIFSRWDSDKRTPVFSAPLENIDSLPFQDLDWNNHTIFINGDVFQMQEKEEALLGNTFHAMMSRGCPFNCTYCYNNYLRAAAKGKGKYYRQMSVERIISELEYAKNSYATLHHIYFWDDNFLSRKTEEIELFCMEYKKQIDLPFGLLGHPSNITMEKLKLLKDAGLEKLQVGLESGSDSANKDIYKRPTTGKTIVEIAKTISELKFSEVRYDIIFNNPFESSEQVRESVETFMQLPHPYIMSGYNLILFPGTYLYEKAVKEQLITPRSSSGMNLDEPLFSNRNSPMHFPLSNRISEKLYEVNYRVGRKQYYNLLLFIAVGTKVPHKIIYFFLNNDTFLTRPVLLLFTSLFLAHRKTRKFFNFSGVSKNKTSESQ